MPLIKPGWTELPHDIVESPPAVRIVFQCNNRMNKRHGRGSGIGC
eukprot:COSAG01_NODE_70613_length_258_cov_0.647799_1_plen_44_part_01